MATKAMNNNHDLVSDPKQNHDGGAICEIKAL